MIDSFMQGVARIPGMDEARRHQALRAAKLIRRRIETGDRPADAEWFDILRSPSLLQLARIHLDEGPGRCDFDPDATDAGSGEGGGRWSELIGAIPDGGLPGDLDANERIGSFELRRMVHAVSKGWEKVDYEALPTAASFRERFVHAARATGRLDCIRGLPLTA